MRTWLTQGVHNGDCCREDPTSTGSWPIRHCRSSCCSKRKWQVARWPNARSARLCDRGRDNPWSDGGPPARHRRRHLKARIKACGKALFNMPDPEHPDALNRFEMRLRSLGARSTKSRPCHSFSPTWNGGVCSTRTERGYGRLVDFQSGGRTNYGNNHSTHYLNWGKLVKTWATGKSYFTE